MLCDYLVNNREAKACPLVLRREERIEHVVELLFRNAGSLILDFNENAAIALPRPQAHFTPMRHRLDGINRQVQNNLRQLLLVA